MGVLVPCEVSNIIYNDNVGYSETIQFSYAQDCV